MTERTKGDLWSDAEAYEAFMGRWSRRVAPLFIAWLDLPVRRSWLDVGCGTGVLTAQIATRCEPARLHGLDRAEGFVGAARRHLPEATFEVGDVTSTALPSGEFDVAVSGLVLNFVTDPHAALREMARVVRPGGHVALYLWDYAGHMQMLRRFFDAARTVDPGAAAVDEGAQFPLCRPGPLRDALTAAGLVDVDVTALDITTPFANFDDYWTPFLGGTGTAPRYCMSLDPEVRERVRLAVRAALPTGPDGEILLAARAWAVRGTVPITPGGG